MALKEVDQFDRFKDVATERRKIIDDIKKLIDVVEDGQAIAVANDGLWPPCNGHISRDADGNIKIIFGDSKEEESSDDCKVEEDVNPDANPYDDDGRDVVISGGYN